MNYVYTRSNPPCSYCERVKALLDAYDIPYTERDISTSKDHNVDFKIEGYGTVPQVFLSGLHIGGFEATATFLREPSEGSITYKVN
jgi:glutaredoxin